MGVEREPTVEGPGRRRDSWSLKTIVENVAGRPIAEFQEPDRPPHPYLAVMKARSGERPSRPSPFRPRPALAPASAPLGDDEEEVDRVYPPFVGATGRELVGPGREHHEATLRNFRVGSNGVDPPESAGPSRRPERIYLHYLLLHLDRLNGSALTYLRNAVEEEIAHRRARPRPSPPGP